MYGSITLEETECARDGVFAAVAAAVGGEQDQLEGAEGFEAAAGEVFDVFCEALVEGVEGGVGGVGGGGLVVWEGVVEA